MVIHTLFVEPFNPIIGAQYIVLGEIENAEGKERLSDLFLLGMLTLLWLSNRSFQFFLGPHISQTRNSTKANSPFQGSL